MKKLNVDFKPLLKRLETASKKNLFGEGAGEYRSAFKGKGFEFTGFRKYFPSDDAHLIDWKASIRSQELLIRTYTEERNLQIVFLLDVSSSMSFSSTPKLKNEYAAELVASLAFGMLEAGDHVGLAMFTDTVVRFIRPNGGARQFYSLTKALADPTLYDGPVDFARALRFAATSLKQNTIVIIVSDFIGTAKQWEGPLRAVAQRSEIIGIMVRDPLDLLVPDVGQVVVSDPFSEHELVLNTSRLRLAYALETKHQVDYLRGLFRELGSDLLILTTNKPFLKSVVDFFRRRGKRWK